MKKPFFNKFLVDQKQNENKKQDAVKGGRPAQTMKWPSDSDEDGIAI